MISKVSLKKALLSLFFVYAAIALLAYFFAERLIFLPPRSSYVDTAEILKLPIPGTTETISARFLPTPGATLTLLYSHGNGNDMGEVDSLFKEFQSHGFSVFAYDYEGYGTSSGSPSEEAVYRDVDAAYSYLTAQLRVPPRQIVSYGFSLGGAAALDVAARREVGGVVLDSTFVTAFRVRTHVSVVPFDRFDNISKIRRLRCPVLILHSRDDTAISSWHAPVLFAAVQGKKELVLFDAGNHGSAPWVEPARYWAALDRFRSIVAAPLETEPFTHVRQRPGAMQTP